MSSRARRSRFASTLRQLVQTDRLKPRRFSRNRRPGELMESPWSKAAMQTARAFPRCWTARLPPRFFSRLRQTGHMTTRRAPGSAHTRNVFAVLRELAHPLHRNERGSRRGTVQKQTGHRRQGIRPVPNAIHKQSNTGKQNEERCIHAEDQPPSLRALELEACSPPRRSITANKLAAMHLFRCQRGRAIAMPALRLPSIAMPLANGSPYLTIQIRRARLAKPFRILSLYPQCLPDANFGAGLYP